MKKHVVSKLSALALAILLLSQMGMTAFAVDTSNVGLVDGTTWKAANPPSGTSGANRMLTAKLGVGTTGDPSITLDIMSDYQTALAKAKEENSDTIILRISNVSYVPLETMQELTKLATAEDKRVCVYADRRDGHLNVLSRVVFDPAEATKDIYPFLYTEALHTNPAVRLFDKYYSNMLAGVHAKQEVDYGMAVNVAVKVDLSKMDKDNLYFYSYDKVSETYKAIADADYTIDENGYVQFTTKLAGDIIITSGEIAKY